MMMMETNGVSYIARNLKLQQKTYLHEILNFNSGMNRLSIVLIHPRFNKHPKGEIAI